MRFAVLDLETANARMHSICQVGVVVFEGSREIAYDVVLLNPQQDFDPGYVSNHGIDAQKVSGAFVFRQIYDQLARALRGQCVVSHTNLDRVVLEQACDHNSVDRFDCRWLESAQVARKTWPQFAERGYELADLAAEFGIEFTRHDALEDARATAKVLLKAVEVSGIGIESWFDQLSRPAVQVQDKAKLRRAGGAGGTLLGKTVALAGQFSQPKQLFADVAHLAGAAAETGVARGASLLRRGQSELDTAGSDGNEPQAAQS